VSGTLPAEIEGYSELVQIGVGGFSTVYRAHQGRFGRTVALKVLHGRLTDDDARRRFERECRAAGAASTHPNVVTVLDAGQSSDGRPYIAMELMEGGSLADRLADWGPLALDEVLDIGVKIAGALGAVHAAGLLHRDIKPQNILVSDLGEPALADFGISAVVRGPGATAGTAALTPLHAPPEVLEGDPTGVASDVYSLGSTLFTLLAGRAPFEGPAGEGLAVVIRRVANDDPPAIGRSDVGEDVEVVLRHALNKSPDRRFASALEFAEALQAQQGRIGHPLTTIHRRQGLIGNGMPDLAAVQNVHDTEVPPTKPAGEPAVAEVPTRPSGEPDDREVPTRPSGVGTEPGFTRRRPSDPLLPGPPDGLPVSDGNEEGERDRDQPKSGTRTSRADRHSRPVADDVDATVVRGDGKIGARRVAPLPSAATPRRKIGAPTGSQPIGGSRLGRLRKPSLVRVALVLLGVIVLVAGVGSTVLFKLTGPGPGVAAVGGEEAAADGKLAATLPTTVSTTVAPSTVPPVATPADLAEIAPEGVWQVQAVPSSCTGLGAYCDQAEIMTLVVSCMPEPCTFFPEGSPTPIPLGQVDGVGWTGSMDNPGVTCGDANVIATTSFVVVAADATWTQNGEKFTTSSLNARFEMVVEPGACAGGSAVWDTVMRPAAGSEVPSRINPRGP